MSAQECFLSNPFAELLGIEIVRCDKALTELKLELRVHLLNELNMGHGGVTMTLLDEVMGRCAHMADPLMREGEPSRWVVTTNIQVTFLRPARGETLTAYAKSVEVDGAKIKVQGWIVDERGKRVAEAIGVFKYI